MTAFRYPNLRLWAQADQLELWQAVLLAMNVEPDHAKERHGTEIDKIAMTSVKEPDPGRVQELFRIAESHLGQALPAVKIVDEASGRRYRSIVRLRDFVTWAERIGWQMPSKLLSLLPPDETPPSDAKLLDDRERTTLLTIIGVLADRAGFDTKNPTTAGRKIVEHAQTMGVKIGKRTVEEHLKKVEVALDKKG